jgi:hypothetical protein
MTLYRDTSCDSALVEQCVRIGDLVPVEATGSVCVTHETYVPYRDLGANYCWAHDFTCACKWMPIARVEE